MELWKENLKFNFFVIFMIHREYAKIKNISEITDEDFLIWVEGIVITVSKNKIVMDDGTGSIEILTHEQEIENVSEKDFLRVIGRVFPTPEGLEIHADILKKIDFSDLELYKEVINIWKKFSEDY